MKNPFNQLINYEGTSVEKLRQFATEHSGNLIFAHISNNNEDYYFVYANSVEMRIPTLEEFNLLKQRSIISADDSITVGVTGSQVVLDYTGVSTEDDWGEIPVRPIIETVDLGLTSGILWTKCNLGAETETDFGNYYQWAATEPLNVTGTTVNPPANWVSCPYTTDGNTFTKYTGSDYSTLQPEDDAATQLLGNSYRIPTKEDFDELLEETNHNWISNYHNSGVNGYLFSNNNQELFLPATGYCENYNLSGTNSSGFYWYSTINSQASSSALYLYFYDNGFKKHNNLRYFGYSIRPVKISNL